MHANTKIVTGLAFTTTLAGCAGQQDRTERQDAVAAAGTAVMPFDLERTTHTFIDTATGGVQDVVSDDPSQEQIRLVREHLRKEVTLSNEATSPIRPAFTEVACRAWTNWPMALNN